MLGIVIFAIVCVLQNADIIETVDLTSVSFNVPLEYTDERSLATDFTSFFIDAEGNPIDAPEGMTISSNSATYNVGKATVHEIGDKGYRCVDVEYCFTVKADFTYTKGYEYPSDIGWSHYYNEIWVVDAYSGKILNVDDVAAQTEGAEYQYNISTESGIYNIAVSNKVSANGASFSPWEETSEGVYSFSADEDYSIILSIKYSEDYDGLLLVLPRYAQPYTDNVARFEKDSYFLEDENDTPDNYYIIKLSDLIDESEE